MPILSGAGVRWLPVEHAGNGPRSREEADGRRRRGRDASSGWRWHDKDGASRPIALDDMIVVAPYNAQVAEIQAALEARVGRRGNVGTVDKFQGREGVVAIYSMASSSREDSPARHGLPVLAQSARRRHLAGALRRDRSSRRRRCCEAGCRTPEQMRMVDALCRFVEYAERQARSAGVAAPTG